MLFCGSRFWDDPRIVEWKLRQIRALFDGATIVHGAARGLDRIAGALAKANGFEVDPHPADWGRYGSRAAGAVRNAKMLDSGVDAIFAFKNGFDVKLQRGGTEMMVEMGLRNDIPVEVWSYVGPSDGRLGGYDMVEVPWAAQAVS